MDSVALLIGATLKPLQDSLKKAQGMVTSFGDKAGKLLAGAGGIGGAITGLFAGASVAAGVKIAVGEFMKIEDANAKLHAALTLSGNAGANSLQKIAAAGAAVSKTTRTSQAAFAEAAGTLARISGIKGDENLIKATKAAVDLGAALGKDGPAAELLGHALQDPQNGMYELAKAGLAFSDAQLKNIQDLQRSGDLLGAQAALMDIVKINTENAAEAAGKTLSGKLDILHNTVTDLAAKIGENLAPAIKLGVDWMTQWVESLKSTENMNALWDFTATAAGYVANAVQAIGVAWKAAAAGVSFFHAVAASAFKKVLEGINWLLEKLRSIGIEWGKIDTAFAVAYEEGAWDHLDQKVNDVSKAMLEPWKGGQLVRKLEETKAAGVGAFTGIEDAAKKASRAITMAGLGMKNITAEQDKLHQEAVRLAESLQSPLEKFNRELEHLNLLRANGLDKTSFERARSKLVLDLQGAIPQQKIAAGGPLAAGSQQLRSALLAYRQSMRAKNPQDAIRKLHEQELQVQKQSENWLRQLVKDQPQVAPFAGL